MPQRCNQIPILVWAGLLLLMLACGDGGFAPPATVPPGLAAAEPQARESAAPGGPADTFQAALLAALRTPGHDDPTVTAALPALTQLHQQQPELLLRYLATSPAWRLFWARDHLFATRRWQIGTRWRYELHGYYTDSSIDSGDSGFQTDLPAFQSRVTLGLAGIPWVTVLRDATSLHAGETAPLALTAGNGLSESLCLITVDDGLVAELFEQSATPERRLTRAALAQLEAEFAPLATHPDWATLQQLLPPGSIREGPASLELFNSFQPGIYEAEIWVNPGEAGLLYLKAFEVTRNTPLSAVELRDDSNERVGWSDDPHQCFFANTVIQINEGDWGHPYAARFEVWFVPDSGQPERRLLEATFKIEGWQP